MFNISKKNLKILNCIYLINKFFSLLRKIFFEPIREIFKDNKTNYFFWSIIIIAVITRLFFLNNPMMVDESSTFLNFVKGNPFRVFYYSSVNNHIFFTLLVKISTFFTGTSPASIRLISFLSGILSVFLTYNLSKKFGQKGIYAALAMATTPYLIFYSTYARSYSLTICLSLIICFLCIKLLDNYSLNNIISLSAFSAVGLLTIPTMILPISGFNIWLIFNLLLKRLEIKELFFKYLIPIFLCTLTLTFVFYLPTIILSGGINSVLNPKFTEPIGLIPTFKNLPGHFYSTLSVLTTQIPFVLIFINSLFLIIGLFSYLKKKEIAKLTLLPSLLFGGFLILLIRTIIAHERSWIFLIPFILILADEGFSFLTRLFSDKGFKYFTIFFIIIAIVFSRQINENRLIDSTTRLERFPEAPLIINYLRENINGDPRNYNINVNQSMEPVLHFYSWYYYYPIKVNGINFQRTDNTFEWFKQAKLDILKYQNKIPRRKDTRVNDSNYIKNIYIEGNWFENSNLNSKVKLRKLANFGDISIYQE